MNDHADSSNSILSRVRLRCARPDDAAVLQAIYAPYVRETAISFELEPPTVEEFRRRICATLEKFPYIVAELDGEAVGYSYASSFHQRAAYGWSAETSIYVRKDLRRSGIGSLLYDKLEEKLQAQNVVNLVAVIVYPNPPSIEFHSKRGYHEVGLMENIGFKLGEWHAVMWMLKNINPHLVPPPPLAPPQHELP